MSHEQEQLRAEAARTRTGVILGSPGYMAPEQAQGKGKYVGPASWSQSPAGPTEHGTLSQDGDLVPPAAAPPAAPEL